MLAIVSFYNLHIYLHSVAHERMMEADVAYVCLRVRGTMMTAWDNHAVI